MQAERRAGVTELDAVSAAAQPAAARPAAVAELRVDRVQRRVHGNGGELPVAPGRAVVPGGIRQRRRVVAHAARERTDTRDGFGGTGRLARLERGHEGADDAPGAVAPARRALPGLRDRHEAPAREAGGDACAMQQRVVGVEVAVDDEHRHVRVALARGQDRVRALRRRPVQALVGRRREAGGERERREEVARQGGAGGVELRQPHVERRRLVPAERPLGAERGVERGIGELGGVAAVLLGPAERAVVLRRQAQQRYRVAVAQRARRGRQLGRCARAATLVEQQLESEPGLVQPDPDRIAVAVEAGAGQRPLAQPPCQPGQLGGGITDLGRAQGRALADERGDAQRIVEFLVGPRRERHRGIDHQRVHVLGVADGKGLDHGRRVAGRVEIDRVESERRADRVEVVGEVAVGVVVAGRAELCRARRNRLCERGRAVLVVGAVERVRAGAARLDDARCRASRSAPRAR